MQVQVKGCVHSCSRIVLLVALLREGDLHAVLAAWYVQDGATAKVGRKFLSVQRRRGQYQLKGLFSAGDASVVSALRETAVLWNTKHLRSMAGGNILCAPTTLTAVPLKRPWAGGSRKSA